MTNSEFDDSRDARSGSDDGARSLGRPRTVVSDGDEAGDRETVCVREILFVELLGGLGDVLISLQAIQALARSHPEARLTVLTFSPGGELLEGDPLVYEVMHAPEPDRIHPHRAREAVEGLLTPGRWDLIVSDTSYDGIDDLIRSCGAPHVVTNLWRSPPPDERVGARFISILLAEALIEPGAVSPPRLHLTPEERSVAAEQLAYLHRPLVFLLPDAGMEVKRWPEKSWGALGRALCDRHGADVMVPVGSDHEQASRVARLAGERARVWPRGRLRELAAALSFADLAVGADTGPLRIAATLDVPTVMLFGPAWHGRYGQPPPHVDLQGHPSCPQRIVSDFTRQPCWYSGTCTLEAPSWRTCVEDISVEDVLTAAAPLLESWFEPEPSVRGAGFRGGTR
jgi:ADP-heptose:LPS heptosyltransferase